MITGTELKQLTDQGDQPKVIVAHNHGTIYGALVITDSPALPKAICDPGTNEAMKFGSLDQVADFLSKVGIKTFQVTI